MAGGVLEIRDGREHYDAALVLVREDNSESVIADLDLPEPKAAAINILNAVAGAANTAMRVSEVIGG